MFERFKKAEEKKDDQSKSEADLLIEKLGATIEEKLSAKLAPITEKVETLSGKWNKMEEEANRSLEAEHQTKNPDGSEVTEEQKRQRREEMLFASTVLTNARITENEVISAIAKEYPQIIASAQDAFAKTHWRRKSEKDYPAYCENVINMLVGQEARKNGLRYNPTAGKFMIEDSAARTRDKDSVLNDPSLTWQDPMNPRNVLSPEDQLRKLGINPEDFEKAEKARGLA